MEIFLEELDGVLALDDAMSLLDEGSIDPVSLFTLMVDDKLLAASDLMELSLHMWEDYSEACKAAFYRKFPFTADIHAFFAEDLFGHDALPTYYNLYEDTIFVQ